MPHDSPRRAEALHPIDCTCSGCCTPAADRFDIAGAARRFVIGLGWGALIAFTLSALTGVPFP